MEIGGSRGQSVNGSNINSNSTSTSLAWDVWELNSNSNSSRMDWTSTSTTSAAGNGSFYAVSGDGTLGKAGGAGHAPLLHAQLHHHDHRHEQDHQQTLYGGDGGSHLHPDPHLVCLKLGKRHYFEDVAAAEGAGPVPMEEQRVAGFPMGSAKKGKGFYGGGGGGGGGASSVSVPRCQVEGCHVALVNAKDYHRRHKVCEMHSKAPKVVVLGLEQRFCQQCSRFHVVSEFEEAKRSCKRRLAGHNERRRKSSHDSIARNSSHHENKVILGGGFPYLTSPTGRALSLLSSKTDSWVPPSDLSSRSSAALRELISENRTAILARQLFLERDTWHLHNHHHHQQAEDLSTEPQQRGGFGATMVPHHHPMFPQPPAHGGWERINESGAHVTLDLMQAPSPAFGFLPARGKAKVEEEECSDLWNSFQGPNLV